MPQERCAVWFLRCIAAVISNKSSFLIILSGIAAACSGASGTALTGSVGGTPAAGGSLANAGSSAIAGTTGIQVGTSSGPGGSSGLGGTGPVGGSATTGGIPSSTGTALTASGGNSSSTGGGQNAIGGAPNSTGGRVNGTGGNTIATGGNQSNTGGKSNSTGGFASSTGGTQVSMGGTQNATGGTPTSTGGTLSATGGSSTSTGGTQNTAGSSASLHSSSSDPTYATAGAWHGYIWPAIESGAALDPNNKTTISPTASEGFRSGGPPYCIKGHVPATPNSLAVAMVGMNTSQERTGGATAAQWTTTGTGIVVNVSNPGGSPLRLQIQTNETGAIATLWCAMITVFDQDVIIAWSQFNTQCFNDNKGSYYNQSVGISTVMVLVPGTSQSGGYDFDFCVNDMAPV